MSLSIVILIFGLGYYFYFKLCAIPLTGKGAVKICLFLTIGLRFLLSSMPDLTFQPVIAGLSLMAVHTMFSIVVLFLLSESVFKYSKRNFPLFFVLFSMLISMLVNSSYIQSFVDIVRLVYLLLLCSFFRSAIKRHGVIDFCKSLFILFFPLIVLQFISMIAGAGKATELDGSISYIGNYSHEASFSFVGFIGACTALIVYRENRNMLWFVFSILAVFSIYLANYRTTIIGLIPVFSFVIFVAISDIKKGNIRIGVRIVGMALAMVTIVNILLSERFSDLFEVVGVISESSLDPAAFSRDMIQVMSGRLFLWSQYISKYASGDFLNLLFGYGPGTWVLWSDLYAHNQLVSYLYEAGVIGLLSGIYLFSYPIVYSFILGENGVNKVGKLGVSIILGVLLTSFASMPLWAIEGGICFALGFSIFENNRNSFKCVVR